MPTWAQEAQFMLELDSLSARAPRAATLAALALALFGSWPVRAQNAARAGMASFPTGTQQVAYSNLLQLRFTPAYPRLREHAVFQQFRGFEDFLRAAGLDPEADVDEVMLGWSGQSLSGPGSYGIAAGRFEPAHVQGFFTRNRLPVPSYGDSDLFVFRSGADGKTTLFTFLNSSLAAFGRRHDLEAILDVQDGSTPALNTNREFQGYAASLEGKSAQWGILTGKAAANVAGNWLSRGQRAAPDLSAFSELVQAVLYRVDWDRGFTAHISIVSNTSESAEGLLKLLELLKATPTLAAAVGSPGTFSLLQSMEARQDGSRLELTISGPPEALAEILKVD